MSQIPAYLGLFATSPTGPPSPPNPAAAPAASVLDQRRDAPRQQSFPLERQAFFLGHSLRLGPDSPHFVFGLNDYSILYDSAGVGVDAGQTFRCRLIQPHTPPIPGRSPCLLPMKGLHTIYYYSNDRAGIQESPNSTILALDLDPRPSPTYRSRPSSATDALSGSTFLLRRTTHPIGPRPGLQRRGPRA